MKEKLLEAIKSKTVWPYEVILEDDSQVIIRYLDRATMLRATIKDNEILIQRYDCSIRDKVPLRTPKEQIEYNLTQALKLTNAKLHTMIVTDSLGVIYFGNQQLLVCNSNNFVVHSCAIHESKG